MISGEGRGFAPIPSAWLDPETSKGKDMTCTKTCCHAYIAEYGEYVYGDAFEIAGVAVFRIVQRSFSGPIMDRVHYTVAEIGEWFDKDRTDSPVSTLIAKRFNNHGYDGKEIS